ncbi:transcriptional regulator with XRE-family HTH domain [Chryseomicrobium aureum]|uniref:helix-turn-helix domain-containing protein n=1 Tax=Chryseomicrobium aureum TaxID=1441723 RepID=UPI00195B8231|nr:helix-turn-helix transcriptional regulator [Chryseomicrobium aureum]MBM7706933.1 transcriptional regulator with XRE-family HTH domain [Chryseomicrobium aureum]
MKIGSLIKFHRTKQGLTQQTLADGICSVPHLSKIENNSKEANEETIRLLLERLSIDLQDVEKLEVEIKELLKQFTDQMYYVEREEAAKSYATLKNKEDLIPFTEHLYLYELYKTRYFIFMNDPDSTDKQLKWLHSHKQNFSQQERYLHSYISALALLLRGKVEEADIQFAQLIEQAVLTPEYIGEINYSYSLIKSGLNQYSPSIFYGKNALQQFKEDFNFVRIVNTQMLLAVNYSRAKMFNEAEEIYRHLIRNTRVLRMNHLLPQIYHNMGDLYHTEVKYDESVDYFNQAMRLLPEESELYMLCLYNKAISEYEAGKLEESHMSFQKLNDIALASKITHYHLFSNFYSLFIQEQTDQAMLYLENKVLPYTKKQPDLHESHYYFSQLLADYFKEKGQYDKAVQLLD